LWDEITHVTSDNENFFLYYNNQFALVIPKNAITSEAQWIKYLTTYVDKEAIKRKKKASLPKKQSSAVLTLLVVIFICLYGVNYYFFKPENDVSRAAETVSNLFVSTSTEVEDQNKIKESTNQSQVNHALKVLDKIDINNS